jgi:predicted AlkP superfamily phosphohydrolase/phosphomutase
MACAPRLGKRDGNTQAAGTPPGQTFSGDLHSQRYMNVTTHSKPRLLVIGLDGATLDLIEPWVAAGDLPTFARLLRAGTSGRLHSVPNTSPGWASFATGLNPANHGIFHASGWSSDRRHLRPMRGSDLQGCTMWRIASDAERQVVVVNVKFTYPAEPINGILLAGADAPAIDAPGFCYPPDYDLGRYRIGSRMSALLKEHGRAAALADAFAVDERRTEIFIKALSQVDWDLAIVIYDLPDITQHFFWRSMATATDDWQHAIRDSYRFIESRIEHLLAYAGHDTRLLILSDHGCGPLCATPRSLAEWLIQNNFMCVYSPAQTPWRQRLTSQVYTWLRHHLNERRKEWLRRRFPALRGHVESSAKFAGIDWPATTAYVGASSFEVWINAQGREPQGTVAPGAEYDRVCHELTNALLEWRDPVTHQPRVRAVHRRDEVYQGRYIDLAPDLTIEWNPAAAPSPDTINGNTSGFDGDHQPEGLLIAVGPEICAGEQIHGAHIVDMAPTILHWLGVPSREPMDGRVLTALFGLTETRPA